MMPCNRSPPSRQAPTSCWSSSTSSTSSRRRSCRATAGGARGSALSKEKSRALCATDSRRYALRESGALAAFSSGCRRLRSRATSSGPQPISSSSAADIVSATRSLRGLDWQQRASSVIRPGDAYTCARAATRAPSRLEMRRTAASRRASSAGRAVRGRHTERRISCAAPLAARGSSRGGHPIADWSRGLHDAF